MDFPGFPCFSQEKKNISEMSHLCWPLLASCRMLAGILFLNAVVGPMLGAPPHSLPLQQQLKRIVMVEYSTSVQCLQQNVCIDGMGYITS